MDWMKQFVGASFCKNVVMKIVSKTGEIINARYDFVLDLFLFFCIFSSPEHEVLMVSYCGQWLSVVRRRASCDVRRPSSVVRRPSTFDVYTLETTFLT